MVKTIKEHLEDTFEDLGEEKLKKFKIKLRDRTEEPIVRQATIDKIKDALDLADVMVNTFTSTGAVPVTIEVLTAIKENKLAEEFREKTRDVAPVVPQPGPRAPSKAEHFIDGNEIELIKRVPNVEPILDELRQKKVITDEDCCTIRAEKTPQARMRVLMLLIKSVGSTGKDLLYEALKKSNVYLIQDLEARR
ncbi:apoptosis-associated speck-like protein containing a CARD [Rhinichthys klamathensis goyatoka]|uniref:apoptosis-associated speck-like protein containing a CARD n=1 Tax=Rhinichthys klamathensis goyatoka TaxID=3034132 RepID=UPI0024B5BFDF|nr:apoptosis-associated speck-like protein containing a CARD [Rhinichthys klamathensis goyatoka]